MKLLLLAFIWTSVAIQVYGQHKIFVSPQGNDNNKGSFKEPVATLDRALNIYRKFKTSEGAEILLLKGNYELKAPIELNSNDGGTTSHPLIISSYKDDEVSLSGGGSFYAQWEKYKKNVYRTTLPPNLDDFEQLFVGEERKILARYPNFNPQITPYGGWSSDAIDIERLKGDSSYNGAYFHVLHAARWGGFHYRIKGFNKDNKPILEGGWQNNRPEAGLHKEYRMVENSLTELDHPNEWYTDGDYLYYYAVSPNKLPKKVATDGLSELIKIAGDQNKPVKNIIIKGLTLKHTGRTFMLTKERLLRSDWTIYRGGAILIEGAENISIENCNFKYLGGNGVFVSKYARKVEVRTCHFSNIGASAISFVGDSEAVRNPNFHYTEFTKYEDLDLQKGPKTENYPKYCVAYDNLIHDVGEVEKQAAGVQIAMAMKISVSHNSIYNCSRAGINVGDGTWGGHLFEYNDVFKTVLETSDHGSFNAWGRDRFWQPDRGQIDANVEKHPGLQLLDAIHTTVIRNNRLRCDHGWDLDLDDGATNYHVYNNLLLKNGIKLREGYHRVVENNICVNNSIHAHVWQKNSGDVVMRNIFGSYYYPIGMKHWGTAWDLNLFDISEKPLGFNEGGRDEQSKIGNPLFIDPLIGDYRVSDNSPAILLGFQNFDMNRFGVISPELKDLAQTPELPIYTPGLAPGAIPSRDGSLQEWLGGKIKNLVGLGEVSATGMHDETGVLVVDVPKGSEMAEIGFRKNDVILDFWGQETHNVERLLYHYANRLPDHSTPIKIWRNQQKHTLEIK